MPEFFGKWKDHSKKQNNTIQLFKLCQSILCARSIVTKLYTNTRSASHRWNGQDWPRKKLLSNRPYFSKANFRYLAVDSDVACTVLLWNLQVLSFTIHSFFAPKIADAIVLYARKVLKRFNHHLNCKREFTMITGKTLHDHFWCSIWKFVTLFSIIYSWYH